MIKKAGLQFLIIIVLFFSILFGLSRINWLSVFKVEQRTQSIEQKLGKVFWKLYSETEEEITSKEITHSIDTLVGVICRKNSIDKSKIKIHILRKDEINAFTLPDNYLVIYSGLITSCENEAELMGVLAHEIAHMEKNHVMKKLVKEIGLSVLISMTSGGSGEAIKEAAKLLSSTAYDRDLESEADLTSVDYLLKASIDPEQFANFLYRFSEVEKNIPEQAFWISTHPRAKERAEAIIEYLKDKTVTKKLVLNVEQWKRFKELATIESKNLSDSD